MSGVARESELEKLLAMLASFGHIAERRKRARRAPKRPRALRGSLGTSSSRRLRRLRQEQRRVALATAGGRLEVQIQGPLAAVDAVDAALELLALADDVDGVEDPRAVLVELLTARECR